MSDGLLEIGRIDRSHGLRGEVVVRLTTTVTSRLDPGSVLQTDRGPLVVASARAHQTRWVVGFEGVSDRGAADGLRGLTLRAAPLEDAPHEGDRSASTTIDDDGSIGPLWVHDLVGRVVFEVDGTERGTVEAVEENPASDLLVLDTGHLVPLRFIERIDEPGRIVVDAPPGLFDL